MILVENAMAKAELLLNPIDRIPFASSYSGMLRYLAGLVQLAAGAVFAYLKSVEIFLTTSKGSIRPAIEQGALYSLHGIANMLRGMIALLPGVNLLLWVYDKQIGRFNYLLEEVPSGVYPLATAKRLAHY